MSDYGLFTYINGTSFDAFNSIDFNYVMDVIRTTNQSYSGSRSYEVPSGYALQAFCSIELSGEGMPQTPVTVSGSTVTWNTQRFTSTIMVCMVAT